MASEAKLLPCPFCGATPHRGRGKLTPSQDGEDRQDFRIWCPHGCAAAISHTSELVSAQWNRRAPSPAPAEGEDGLAAKACAAKRSLIALHKKYLPQAYEHRASHPHYMERGDMQRMCDALLDGSLCLESLAHALSASRAEVEVERKWRAETTERLQRIGERYGCQPGSNRLDWLEGHLASLTSTGTHPTDPAKEHAITSWNRRAPSPAPAGTDNADLIARLRKPVMYHSNPEHTNAERREAAAALSASRAEVGRLKAHVAAIANACVYSDSYGVEGSSFQCCLCCTAGGAPGLPFEHTKDCPVGKAEETAERWYKERADEIAEYEAEEKALRAQLAEARKALERIETEPRNAEFWGLKALRSLKSQGAGDAFDTDKRDGA